ncbi:MAG: hypothetical protein ACYC4S_09845 [Rhodoferax sp.]
MFSKLFKRTKAATPATPATPEPVIPAPNAVVQKKSTLDAFREEWDNAHEVVEGDGGDTEWGTWTEAVENEKKAFAPTVPMPLGPK